MRIHYYLITLEGFDNYFYDFFFATYRYFLHLCSQHKLNKIAVLLICCQNFIYNLK